MALPLSGYTVALPETRQLDVLAALLERRGAAVWRCPMVAILDAPDPGPIEDWLHAFLRNPPDELILLTGEGLRRLVDFAKRRHLKDELVAQLAKVRKITRGPKPVRALKELGLEAELVAIAPTTDGVIQTLQAQDLQGHRVDVQLYGTEPNEKLIEFLRAAGATVRTVAPYIYADAADDAKVQDLIQAMTQGVIQAIAFTSQAQYRRLQQVAERHGLTAELATGLAQVKVAAVGPVVAEDLQHHRVRVDLMPEEAFFMKPLVSALVKSFTGKEDTQV